jgi:hypothetical protein
MRTGGWLAGLSLFAFIFSIKNLSHLGEASYQTLLTFSSVNELFVRLFGGFGGLGFVRAKHNRSLASPSDPFPPWLENLAVNIKDSTSNSSRNGLLNFSHLSRPRVSQREPSLNCRNNGTRI